MQFTATSPWRKSTRSNGANGSCVEVAAGHVDPCTWRKSTRSNGANGSCVEVGAGTTVIGIRDTKDRGGGTLVTTPGDWSAFLTDLR